MNSLQARPTRLVLQANNVRSLISQLRRIGRRVGLRTGTHSRTKNDMELFCLRRYVATLASYCRLTYPYCIEKTESPDFMIRAGSNIFGLEVRQATDQSFQQQLTKYEDQAGDLDDGWIGNIPERQWCADVITAVGAKVAKIKNYEPAQRHDILIYSNHPTDMVRASNSSHLEHVQLHNLATEQLREWRQEPRLGTISVIDGRILLHDLGGQLSRWKVVDLLPIWHIP